MSPSPAHSPADHAALMDRIYGSQRHIYDFTRKFYLIGRDRLIDDLNCRSGDAVLEIACGTGRNLARISKRWPGAELYGVDISREMLASAQTVLEGRARLAAADACRFDAPALFGRASFDRVILSYCLSMIPDWTGALDRAAALVAPGGSLHVVDFGDLSSTPRPLRSGLRAWLTRFHVEPRDRLAETGARVASVHGLKYVHTHGPWNYYQSLMLRAPN